MSSKSGRGFAGVGGDTKINRPVAENGKSATIADGKGEGFVEKGGVDKVATVRSAGDGSAKVNDPFVGELGVERRFQAKWVIVNGEGDLQAESVPGGEVVVAL
ncbi:hypothetical protein DYB30_006442 [Aphanomyces astaci]|uniref:Uncharacterized protein n=1 Tax=Aphanomyces astaci TaxID=112090 RepID=A0A397DQV5_APHAT|nr:hypothetical protein DYB30_006442 [Aphanomyces astaci]RHZ07243.1 hypothetical protein DYB31_007258 [Aphanomyces astaci]